MSKTIYSNSELVEKSVDYFTANPDVGYLVAVTGTGAFYRPEREEAAQYEARICGTAAVRIHRSDVEKAQSGTTEVADLPTAVGTLELVLATGKMDGTTPRELAETIYWAALQNGMSQAGAEEMLASVADFLMTKIAAGLTNITFDKTAVGAVITAADASTSPAAPATDSTTSAAPTASTAAAAPAKVKKAPAAPKKKALTEKAAA